MRGHTSFITDFNSVLRIWSRSNKSLSKGLTGKYDLFRMSSLEHQPDKASIAVDLEMISEEYYKKFIAKNPQVYADKLIKAVEGQVHFVIGGDQSEYTISFEFRGRGHLFTKHALYVFGVLILN